MSVLIHYEREYRCKCGRWLVHKDQKCGACAIKSEERDVEEVKARVRERLDIHRYAYNEHGQPL